MGTAVGTSRLDESSRSGWLGRFPAGLRRVITGGTGATELDAWPDFPEVALGRGGGDPEVFLQVLAAQLAPVTCEGLRIEDVEGFLALIPEGCEDALQALAAAVVKDTDPLRAPLTEEEIAIVEGGR